LGIPIKVITKPPREGMILILSPVQPFYQMLISSNQLAGDGCLNIPMSTTEGANPYKRKTRVFWKRKSISNNFNARDGKFIKVATPLELRLLGTGIFSFCFILKRNFPGKR
jgi:hypothetical protein